MDLTQQIELVKNAAILVDSLTIAALATDSANSALQSALRESRSNLQISQDILLTMTINTPTNPDPLK